MGQARPGRSRRDGAFRAPGAVGTRAGGPDGGLAVCISTRFGIPDGRGLREHAQNRDRAGDLWRRTPRQFRFLRLTGARFGVRPQRLRRGTPGPLGVGPVASCTSIWVAGRQNGLAEGTCEDAALWCAAAYRRQIARLAGQPLLARSLDRMDIDRMRQEMADWSLRAEIERSANFARLRTSDRALPKLTREPDGVRHIVEQPPVVTHVSGEEKERLIDGLEAYLQTIPPHWRRVLSSYVVVDVAHKVVG